MIDQMFSNLLKDGLLFSLVVEDFVKAIKCIFLSGSGEWQGLSFGGEGVCVCGGGGGG